MNRPNGFPWRRELLLAALVIGPAIFHVRWSGDVLRARGKDNLLLGNSPAPGTTRIPHFLLSPAVVRGHEAAVPDAMVRDVQLRRLRDGDRFYVVEKTDGNTRWTTRIGEAGEIRETLRSERMSFKDLPPKLAIRPPDPGTTVFSTWKTSSADSTFYSFAGITTSGILVEWNQPNE